jgi:hypothetical protein
MPKLSLYRPEKSNDFKFIDRQIYELFQVGGTDVFVHKYIGPIDPTDPNKAMGPSTIQDVLFLENRDRKYDTSIYQLRGVYNVQDIDFNLSQFGLFLQNDTIFMTVHINNSVDTIGRKIIAGDVFELPHLKDEYALNDISYALKRFYVVDEITRAAEGFSATWYPHLYRIKLKPLVDSQEFKDILNRPVDDDNFTGEFDEATTYYPGQIIRHNGDLYEVTAETTGNLPPNTEFFRPLESGEIIGSEMSDYLKTLAINEAVVREAEADSPLSGYDIQHFWTLAADEEGNTKLVTIDEEDLDASGTTTADTVRSQPLRSGYQGYLLGDGIPPNGAPYGFGISFPDSASRGDYFLRTDYFPNRLFRFDGKRWIKYEDQRRMTISNTDTRQTYKTKYINNNEVSNVKFFATDTFIVADPQVFRPDDPTISFDLMANKIITKENFDEKYGIEVWLNDIRNPVTSTFEEDGKFAFIMQYSAKVGDTLRWTLYEEQIPQRQSISKALRPRADL